VGLIGSLFGKKPAKTCACLCLLPDRHSRGLDREKLDRVLRAYANLTAFPVVRQFHLNSPEQYRIRYHPDSDPPSVSFLWTIPADLEEEVIRTTREIWNKISAINDQEGIDGMLAHDAAMREGK
jgi:hypothetical protein